MVVLKLPKNYTSQEIEGQFQYLDPNGNGIYFSRLDNSTARLKVWDHYYKQMGTDYVRFYETEKNDNKQLIYILIIITLFNIVLGVINLYQQNLLFGYIFGG